MSSILAGGATKEKRQPISDAFLSIGGKHGAKNAIAEKWFHTLPLSFRPSMHRKVYRSISQLDHHPGVKLDSTITIVVKNIKYFVVSWLHCIF